MANKELIRILAENNLKITPQRTAVLEVVTNLRNHPTADDIAEYIRFSYPHITLGTIYKILNTFTKLGIIEKINTDNDITRYDPVLEKHHHIYCAESERIEDFYDEELKKILDNYFIKKKIPGFIYKDYKLQIMGKFKESDNKK